MPTEPVIQAFVITAVHETDRQENLNRLASQLPGLERVEAIYPTRQKIPFLHRMMGLSRERTGTALNEGEIGVLLSNRKIWREVLQRAANDTDSFLILESDSILLNPTLLTQQYHSLTAAYDLFFFGAWSGHMQLFRSSRQRINGNYVAGTPFIKTVYGAYGYSVNRIAARYLLRQTARIAHPVDQYKYFIGKNALRIGGVMPELVSHLDTESMIGHKPIHPLRRRIFLWLLDMKNAVICFFN